MEVVNQASVITLDSDTDDEVSSSMLRRIPQRSSPHVVFRGAENGKDVEDDEQISRLRRLKRMIDRTDTVETKALPNTNNPFSSVDSGSGFHFQQTSPRRMVDNTLRSYVGVRARSRSLPFPEYDRLANNVPPVAGPPEFLPWRRALNRHKTPPVEGYYDLARRYTTQFDDEYEDLEDDLGQPSYPVTRWPSPLEADLDINLRDQPVDLADELTPQSFDKVLATILEVLPDVCPDYVREKYQERLPWGNADSLLNDILADDKYPKRKSKTKRAREADEDATALTEFVPNDQLSIACRKLQTQFPRMRANYITTILKLKRSVYQTILTLSEIERSSETSKSTAYEPLRKRRRGDICIDNIDDPKLRAQFRAAHKKIAEDEETVNNRKKEIEEENIATARAFELKDVSECQCCFDTYSNAKIVICNGEEPHTFCMECLQGHIKAQLDLQKHEICCMDASGCEAAFSRSSKKKAVDDTTFERLERVQQQNELRTAGLPLTECPFCEFAAICPPVEVDREFRCQRVDCQIISCRLCNQKSHLPLTCEEHKKEQGVDQRHQIEEEMTKAYLRMCPKCKIPIVKEGGCNKITCSRCRSHICDVCGKDITKEGYKHFGRQCPQADATFGTERAVQRVKAAETSARQQVLSENPDLSAKDLEIVESEAVKRKAEAALNNGPWIGGHIDAVHANLLPHRQVGIIRRGVIHDRMVPQQIHPPALMPFQPPPATDWGRTAHGIMYPGFPLPNAGYGVAHPQPDVYQQPTAPTYHQPFQMVAPLNMHPHEGYATSRPLVPNQFPQGTLPMQQFMPTAWQPPAQQRLPNLGQPIWNGMSEADLLTRQNVILQQQAHMQQWQIQTGARIHQQVQERLQQQRNAIRTRPGMGE